jgi:hypothetical protein
MFQVLFAILIEFAILAIPTFIIFKKLYSKQTKSKFASNNTLLPEEAQEYRDLLISMDTYLLKNMEYLGLFLKHPILYQYTNYYIIGKKNYIDEYNKMLDTYGSELFSIETENKMNFLSLSFGTKIYFTNHGFVHFCKWIKEESIFDKIISEMYNALAQTNGCGMTQNRIQEIITLFNDIREIPEYCELYKPFNLTPFTNSSTSSSITSISSNDNEDDIDNEINQYDNNTDSYTDNEYVDEKILEIIHKLMLDITKNTQANNGDCSNLENIMLQNVPKIKNIINLKNQKNIADAINSSDTDNNKQINKELNELDKILSTENQNTLPTFSSFYNPFKILNLFTNSSYLKDDFNNNSNSNNSNNQTSN